MNRRNAVLTVSGLTSGSWLLSYEAACATAGRVSEHSGHVAHQLNGVPCDRGEADLRVLQDCRQLCDRLLRRLEGRLSAVPGAARTCLAETAQLCRIAVQQRTSLSRQPAFWQACADACERCRHVCQQDVHCAAQQAEVLAEAAEICRKLVSG